MKQLKAEILWETDYYDGPVSGVVEVKSQWCWFVYVTDQNNYRKMYVYALTKDQLINECYWHKRFELEVNDEVDLSVTKKFYEDYEPFNNDYENNKLLGYFLWPQ